MVRLITKDFNIEDLELNFFESVSGGRVVGAFYIEGENIIVVEELNDTRVCLTIFDYPGLEIIPTEKRVEEYDGFVQEDIYGDLRLLSKIVVDGETGAETVFEEAYKGKVQVYRNKRARYSKFGSESFKERVERALFKQSKEMDDINKEVLYFNSLSDVDKTKFLKNKFMRAYKLRWESGVEPEEIFLSGKELKAFDSNPKFKACLKAVLNEEAPILGKDADTMFSNIYSVI